MKKTMCIALSFAIAIGCFTGCSSKRAGKGKDNQTVYKMDTILNKPGEFPIVKEEYKDTTITIGIAQSTLITDYKDNTFTKALEEKLGCNIEFQLLPSSDTAQKVELMIAAGGQDLPDILMMPFEDGQLAAYGRNGTIIDLKQYYDNSAYYLNKMFDAEKEKYDDDIKRLITLSDGSMYYVPKYNKSLQNEYAAKCWIYQPWLDKLGLEKPNTLSEFKDMLKAFKEKDPNGNGKADEIPLAGYKDDMLTDFVMASFLPIQRYKDYMYLDGKGKVHAGFMEKEWKEGLKYLNSLYEEGLLSDTKFTQDKNQLTQLKSATPTLVGAFVDFSPVHTGNVKERTMEYTYLEPLKNGKNGVRRAATFASEPYCGMVVTKNCKHPELAFRLGDLMCSEEMTIWNRWGEKGVDWVEPKADEKSMYESMGYKAKISPIMVWGEPSNHHWMNIGPGYRDYDIALGMTAASSSDSEYAISLAMPSYVKAGYKYPVKKYIYDIDEYSEVSQYQSDIKSYVDEQMALFITGNKDIDKEWNAYIKHLKSIGADKYLELTQKAYDKNGK